jgi:hypothetical protein
MEKDNLCCAPPQRANGTTVDGVLGSLQAPAGGGFANKRSVCHVEIAPSPPPHPSHPPPCFTPALLPPPPPPLSLLSIKGGCPLIYCMISLKPSFLNRCFLSKPTSWKQKLPFQPFSLETEALLPTFSPWKQKLSFQPFSLKTEALLPNFIPGNRSSPCKLQPWKQKLSFQPISVETEALLNKFPPWKKKLSFQPSSLETEALLLKFLPGPSRSRSNLPIIP